MLQLINLNKLVEIVLPLSRVLYFLFFFIIFNSSQVFAQYTLNSIQKIVVFPTWGLEGEISDQVWWQIREQLTHDGRFLVASRRMMINRQVLSPRKIFSSADAVILGRILESDALVVTSVEKSVAFLRIYRTEDGLLLWDEKINLNPSIPVEDQSSNIYQALVSRFLKALPYNGYQIKNPNNGYVYINEGSDKMAFIQVSKIEVNLGDKINWIRPIYNSIPLLKLNPKIEIAAKGEIVEVTNSNLIKVKMDPSTNETNIGVSFLVRVQKNDKMNDEESWDPQRQSEVSTEYLIPSISDQKPIREQTKEATFIGFLFNLGLLLLVIF